MAYQGIWEASGRVLDHSGPIFRSPQPTRGLKIYQNLIFTPPPPGNSSYLPSFLRYVHLAGVLGFIFKVRKKEDALAAQASQEHKLRNHNDGRKTPTGHLPESEILTIFLGASAPKNCKKEAVIKSAASAASTQGGCAGSRLDHGFKLYVIRGGCASGRLISGFSDCDLLKDSSE